MIAIRTAEKKIPAAEIRDGDWVVADFGDQLVLARYQDSLVQGEFRPVLLDEQLLEQLGFGQATEQPQGSETTVYERGEGRVSVINGCEFVFEGGAKGRIAVDHLHLLQQIWRQTFEQELITDFLEQPHEILI